MFSALKDATAHKTRFICAKNLFHSTLPYEYIYSMRYCQANKRMFVMLDS